MARAATISACVLSRPPGDADHHLLDPGRQQPRLQPADLDVVDLRAALVAAGRVGRDVGEALDPPLQRELVRRQAEVELDPPHAGQALAQVMDRVAVAGRAHPIGQQPVQVDVGDDQLLLVRRTAQTR